MRLVFEYPHAQRREDDEATEVGRRFKRCPGMRQSAVQFKSALQLVGLPNLSRFPFRS